MRLLDRIRDVVAVARAMLRPETVREPDKEQDHAQADPDPRRGADDRGGDPAAGSSTSELMSAIAEARATLAQSGTVVDAAAVLASDASDTILDPCARIRHRGPWAWLVLDTAEHGLSVGHRVRASCLPDGTHLRDGVATVREVIKECVLISDEIVALADLDYVYPELDYTGATGPAVLTEAELSRLAARLERSPDIAPHVIAPCPTCGAPARTGAVHYASVTAQRPCPASWKGRGP